VHFGYWISSCHGPFSLGVRIEDYDSFISLIFQFMFFGLRQTETTDTKSADTGGKTVLNLLKHIT
jgi:hypothetical protein